MSQPETQLKLALGRHVKDMILGLRAMEERSEQLGENQLKEESRRLRESLQVWYEQNVSEKVGKPKVPYAAVKELEE